MTKRFRTALARPLLLAALAAWIIAVPSVAGAQQRGDPQARARPQQQQHDVRRGSGFSGMLGEIAGARLDRAHAAQRSARPQPQLQRDRGPRRR